MIMRNTFHILALAGAMASASPARSTNGFFVNLIDMVTEWFPVGNCEGI